MNKNSYYYIIIAVVATVQVFQVVFASIFTFQLMGQGAFIWINNNEKLYFIVVHVGGVLSFPALYYVAVKSEFYKKNENISILKGLAYSTGIGILLLLRFFFPFGVVMLSVVLIAFTFFLCIHIIKKEYDRNL